jgi:flagellar M-ring protein FliF
MAQWKKILASFSMRQRVAILLAMAVAGAGLWALTRWRREADFRPLYTALEADDAGAVVSRLKETGVEYRLSEDGRTILAPSAKVAEARLSMAAAGLPKTGRIGFELFDSTNFGVTEFAEHVNYGRALEGELERSVMCLAAVERARVHLTFPKDSVFLEARQPAKASVILKVRPGARLTPQNVIAVSHLVASAVEGLAPDAVSVLDMQGNLLSRPRKALTADGTEASDGMLEFRQSVEKDLLAKIHATLEPLAGPEKFRASVSADCDFSSGEQSEETFDPARSVMVTSQKTEDISGAAGSSGVPGTASNLPRPTSRPGASSAGLARRTENITYQSSRVVRRMRLPLGNLRRMSVAVIVDQGVRWEGTGAKARKVLEPPPPERMKSIRELVAGAIGFNAERGDQLIVESLPFESTLQLAPPEVVGTPAPSPASPSPAWLETLRNVPKLLLAGGATLILLLALAAAAVLRRRKRRRGVQIESPRELPSAQAENAAGRALAGTADGAKRIEQESVALPELPPAPTKKADLLAGRLRDVIKADPAASAQVLRTWLAEEEE